MTQSAGQRSQLQADLTEARTLLKLTSRQSSERLERLAAEKEAELSTAQSRLADAHRYCSIHFSSKHQVSRIKLEKTRLRGLVMSLNPGSAMLHLEQQLAIVQLHVVICALHMHSTLSVLIVATCVCLQMLLDKQAGRETNSDVYEAICR